MQQAARLFAAQNQLGALGSAGINPAWSALQLSRSLENPAGTQSRQLGQRSPTDSTRMDCSEQKQQKPKIQRQSSQRQLAPVFPSSSTQPQPATAASSNQASSSSAVVGSGKGKRRTNGTPMSRSPSPAVSVITISSESGEDNKNLQSAASGEILFRKLRKSR